MMLVQLSALAYRASTESVQALFPMEEIDMDDETKTVSSKDVQDKFAKAAAAAYREQPKAPTTACSSSLHPGTRLLLTAFVSSGNHGSTALQQALMSAENVGTLCGGGNWECEVAIGEHRCGICTAFDRPVSTLPCIACAAHQNVSNWTESFRANLELFEPYWMAQTTKQVLAVKWAPIWSASKWSLGEGDAEPVPTKAFDLEESETATVPSGMAASGVDRVKWGVIIMHRPWCMWNMSSHAREGREDNLKAWATDELKDTEKLVAMHRKLALDQVPVLVTNYAQLLWRPDEFIERVEHFAPCAGTIDLNFVPKLGVDVFEPNMLKIEGSIISYGQAVKPESLGVQTDTRADTGTCTAPAEELYAGLDEGQRRRVKLAEVYLMVLANSGMS